MSGDSLVSNHSSEGMDKAVLVAVPAELYRRLQEVSALEETKPESAAIAAIEMYVSQKEHEEEYRIGMEIWAKYERH